MSQSNSFSTLFNRKSFQWPNQQHLSEGIAGKTILVTGAGGSIGSALCLHIASLQPRKLVLLGRGEHSLYAIQRRLSSFSDTNIELALGDIQEIRQLEHIFALHRPQLIFHTAAYKHVNMLEQFPCQATLNNVLGTLNVMQVSRNIESERLVFISTNKAVNPTSLLGATKKLCECMLNQHVLDSVTDLVSVRFGNVFRSSGNVVELFEKQVRDHRRITITDPNAQRFYMDVEDATHTVVNATLEAQTGEVAIMDMGSPITIGTLADGIVESLGLKPHEDVYYDYIGLQHGEKLVEQLYTEVESERIRRVGPIMYTQTDMEGVPYGMGMIDELINRAQEQNSAKVRSFLNKYMPTHIPVHSE